jgi:hypothetical protein
MVSTDGSTPFLAAVDLAGAAIEATGADKARMAAIAAMELRMGDTLLFYECAGDATAKRVAQECCAKEKGRRLAAPPFS